ncbi:MAG TPA: hypothetical protein VIN65_10370 [Candidatus Dormibacteraeota bacterium]
MDRHRGPVGQRADPALPLPTPSLAVTLPAITVAPLPTASLPSLPLPTPALTLPTAPGTGPAPTAALGSSSSSSSAPTSPWIAAVPTALVLAAIAVAAGTTTGTPTSTPMDAVLAGSAAPAAPGQAISVGSQGWGAGYELLGRISGLENAIARQAADLQALAQPRTDASQAPGRGATGDAQGLVGQQRQLAARLEATLQQEYVVYASAAQDPGHASALVAAASAQPARIRDAVDYDVQAVQAALAQQAAIAGAAQSDPIGLEGSTGNSTGAHCHFEVRVHGVPVDPRAYLRPGSL